MMMAGRLKSWTLELWALAGTLAMTAVLIALLAVFDGRAFFDWNSITLNTIVSTLSVIMKALLLFTAAECIGQWKWIMLHHGKRSLLDFERVDQASRGPLGCLELIWRKETPWLLRLGLVVTILAIAIDPFSQQLVQVEQGTRYVDAIEGTWATTTRSTNYRLGGLTDINQTFPDQDEGATPTPRSAIEMDDIPAFEEPSAPPVREVAVQADLRMQAAILQGLAQPLGVVQQQVDVVCPSSANCTFDRFETLGVCHRCEDLTEELGEVDRFGDFFNDAARSSWHPDNATAFALPNGHFLANTTSCRTPETALDQRCVWTSPAEGETMTALYAMTAYGTGHPNRTNSFQDIDTLIWSTSVIYMDEERRKRRDADAAGEDTPEERPWNYWPRIPLRATECALYYCVKEVDEKFEGNLVRETVREAHGYRRTPESFQRDTSDGYYDEDDIAPENVPDEPGSLVFDRLQSAYGVKNLVLNHTVHNTSYVMSQGAVLAISSFFQDALRYMPRDDLAEKARKRIPSVVEVWNGQLTAGLGRKGQIEPPALAGLWRESDTDMATRFETLATSMTNEMRRNRGQYETFNATVPMYEPVRPDDLVVGSIGLATTRYRVEWYWIALHGVILLGSLLFCAVTIAYSRGVPVWKSHSLATMSQGSAIVDFGPTADSLGEMEKRAKTIMVGLAGEEGSRLLARKNPDPGEREPSLRSGSPRLESMDIDDRTAALSLH